MKKLLIYISFIAIIASCSQAPKPRPFAGSFYSFEDPRLSFLLNIDNKFISQSTQWQVIDDKMIYRVKSSFHYLSKMNTDDFVYYAVAGTEEKRILAIRCGTELLTEYDIYNEMQDLADEICKSPETHSVLLDNNYFYATQHIDSMLSLNCKSHPILKDKYSTKLQQILSDIDNYKFSYAHVFKLDYNVQEKINRIIANHQHPELKISKKMPPKTSCDKQSIEIIYEEIKKAEEYSELLMNIKHRGVYLSVECLAITEAMWNENQLKKELKKIKEIFLITSCSLEPRIIAMIVINTEKQDIFKQLNDLPDKNIILDKNLKSLKMDDSEISVYKYLERAINEELYIDLTTDIQTRAWRRYTGK